MVNYCVACAIEIMNLFFLYFVLNSGDDSYFDDYRTWQEVHAYIEGLAAKFPDLATVWQVGTTYEGRPMKAITLSTKPNSGKPTLWFDG